MPGASEDTSAVTRLFGPELDFEVPEDRIARHPVARRADARLLVVRPDGGGFDHRHVRDLPSCLRAGDLLVVNDSRVMAARLRATRASGGAIELVCLAAGPGPIPVLARPARRLSAGEVLTLPHGRAEILAPLGDGQFLMRFEPEPADQMARAGEVPLPPYLHRTATAEDLDRYQTLFARSLGSAAAPTAGLHFDPPLLEALSAAGVGLATVTLHVGLGTFLPLRPEQVASGELHEERYDVPAATVEAIARARASGGRVVAVGTTTARTLESATARGSALPSAGPGATRLFIRPPYTFRAFDALMTNFHLPGSSLLLLVAARVGPRATRAAYDEALATGYRFYSYGDAMLVL